jgi:hypothetical protein
MGVFRFEDILLKTSFFVLITMSEQDNVNDTMANETIHFVLSGAPLLSGELTDCADAQDESCVGGVAAVTAFLRYYGKGEPSLVLPFADRDSPFVQMHPLVWNVNRLVFQDIFGFRVFTAPPSLLTQHNGDFDISQRDLSGLQSEDFPYLLTNVAIPPSISWSRYTIPVFFDDETRLAVLVNINDGQPMTFNQIESTLGVLDYIARVNVQNGCSGEIYGIYDTFLNRTDHSDSRCWIPVVVFADSFEKYEAFKTAVTNHVNPPALLIDVDGNDPAFETPQKVGNVWVTSVALSAEEYYHHKLTLSPGGKNVTGVEFIRHGLDTLNATLKDEEYASNIDALREQANQAAANDPVVGQATFMPASREEDYRRCKAGECELGNLFTDALRWWSKADFAVTSSGGYRGSGWEAGDVRVSDIWAGFPFPNNPCTGVMNGISVFKMFNYSINVATFEGMNTNDGDRLLQVSGLKVVFNKEREGDRLVAIEVWDSEAEEYAPLEQLKLYKFCTDSFMCGGFDPFPEFLVDELVTPGEEPGKTSDALLLQDIVTDYLQDLDSPYEAAINGRIVNDTSADTVLNFIQTADDCVPGTFWQPELSICEKCPERIAVSFLSEALEFDGLQGSKDEASGQISMVNSELDQVMVVPKSKPAWLNYSTAKFESGDTVQVVEGEAISVPSGGRIKYSFQAVTSELEPGTAQGTVAFAVLNGGNFPGCAGQDATFEVLMRVSPVENLNHLGPIKYLGFTLTAVAVITSLFLSGWVWYYRNLRIVKTLQPFFLMTISTGMLVMALAIIPLSIDDGTSSQRGCDIACMASPWLLSMGFTVAMSALFSKLWRINKLFGATSRRMRVREVDVMAPFALLFTLNFTFMLVWTLADPLRFVRLEIAGEPWNTYGSCQSSDDGSRTPISFTMTMLVGAVNVVALFVACKQAYQARNISDEFSEAKNMGVGLFSWFQLIAVGFPMLFLIDSDNPTARYFLQVFLVFAISMSMQLLIYVPMIIQAYKVRKNGGRQGTDATAGSANGSRFNVKHIGTTRISGLEGPVLSHLSDDLESLPFNDANPNADLQPRKTSAYSGSSLFSIDESLGTSDTSMKDGPTKNVEIVLDGFGGERRTEISEMSRAYKEQFNSVSDAAANDVGSEPSLNNKSEEGNTDQKSALQLVDTASLASNNTELASNNLSNVPRESAPPTKGTTPDANGDEMKRAIREKLERRRKELLEKKLELEEKRSIVYFR